MIPDLKRVRIFLKPGPTDMRKNINGLSAIASELMEQNIFTGNLYLFCNRNKHIIKILYWHKNGFCLWQKRLEKHTFPWPKDSNEKRILSLREFQWLLEGIDFFNTHEILTFSDVI